MSSYSELFTEALEQVKFYQSLPPRSSREMDISDVFATLPHPAGRGIFICGNPALKTLRRAAKIGCSNSRKSTRIDEDDVFTHVKSLFSGWYLTGSRNICATSAGELMNEAIKLASIEIKAHIHIYPVHLGHASGIDEFSIGPVKFVGGRAKEKVLEYYINKYEGQKNNKDRDLCWLIEDCYKYYSSFGWIAVIDVEPCVHKTSWRHGKKQTQDALNCINVLLGKNYSHHMAVGGPQFATDRRSALSIEESGNVEISSSTDWLGHALGETWWHVLNGDEGSEIVRLMGIAIREGNRLDHPINLSMRIIDAISWYGEAIRDNYTPSSIVKYVTALERLFVTKKCEGTLKSAFEARSAAFTFSAIAGDIEEIKKIFSRLYTLRSKIVHGKAAPQFSKMTSEIYEFDRYVRIAIQQYIYISREKGLTNNSSAAQLDEWLEKIVEISNKLALENTN